MRIQVVDRDGRAMFELGSAKPRPLAMEIVKVIAKSIAGMPGKVMIEGHTDSYGFKNDGSYTNWELSSDRANAIRRLLIKAGVQTDRIARVAGYANTKRLVLDVPMDPRNRRISIILLDEAREEQATLEVVGLEVAPEELLQADVGADLPDATAPAEHPPLGPEDAPVGPDGAVEEREVLVQAAPGSCCKPVPAR